MDVPVLSAVYCAGIDVTSDLEREKGGGRTYPLCLEPAPRSTHVSTKNLTGSPPRLLHSPAVSLHSLSPLFNPSVRGNFGMVGGKFASGRAPPL